MTIISWTRRGFCATAALTLSFGAAFAQDSITLKTVTPFDIASPLSISTHELKRVFEEESDGRIKIQILGGPEVVPSRQQFDGLRNGVIDIMTAAVPYYAGAVPESFALLYSNQNGQKMRETGMFDFMRKVHRDRVGLHYLANGLGQPSTAFRFYFKQPIESADFSGMKIRVSTSTKAIVEALGGTPVSIPYSDVYTAMERGVADGFGSTYVGIAASGFDEVIDYVLQEPFYSLNAPILVNGTVWDGLSDDLKAEFERIGPIYEAEIEAQNAKTIALEDKALSDAGIKLISLPEEESKAFRQQVQDIGWSAYKAQYPDGADELRSLAMQ